MKQRNFLLLVASAVWLVNVLPSDAVDWDFRRGIIETVVETSGRPTGSTQSVFGSVLADVSVFQNCFGPTPEPSCLAPFDCNANGEIELSDYAVLYGRSVGLIGSPCGMTLIPGGEIAMGDHHDAMADALPVHAIFVDSFYMDIHEIHNQQYADFLSAALSQGSIEVVDGLIYPAGGTEVYCEISDVDADSRIRLSHGHFSVIPGKELHPMLEVSWYGAAAYANWRSEQDGRSPCYDLTTWDCDFDANGFRLPTEAEWEYAARGGERAPYRRYPWGDSINGANANYWNSADPYEVNAQPWTTPAGYFDGGQTPTGPSMLNGYGLYDISGNAWEWCNDWFSPSYYETSEYDNPRGPATGGSRAIRGGSWLGDAAFLRCAVRYDRPADRRGASYGFRLVLGSP